MSFSCTAARSDAAGVPGAFGNVTQLVVRRGPELLPIGRAGRPALDPRQLRAPAGNALRNARWALNVEFEPPGALCARFRK